MASQTNDVTTQPTNQPTSENCKELAPAPGPRQYQIVWFNVLMFTYQHAAAIYGVYLLSSAMWSTVIFNCAAYLLSALGVTAGAHRLWSHRSFTATTPLQTFLMLCQSLANQSTVFEWVRDHRVHHKHSDTDADPHNASRGLFYSHIGWVLVKKHPEVARKGGKIDLTDICENPVLAFQKRHAAWLIPTFAHVIPVLLPMVLWGETLVVSYHVNMLRYLLGLHAIFSINSIAHKFGSRPYDNNILPSQNFVTTLATLGEGFHNYHHTFPYDYKAGELGHFFNFTTYFIDFCALLGLAYDRRFPTEDVVVTRMMRTGDGARKNH